MGTMSKAKQIKGDVRRRSNIRGGNGSNEGPPPEFPSGLSDTDAVQAGAWISDDDLAWRLVRAFQPFLDESEILWLYVYIGSGDPFCAIETLLRIAIERSLPVEPELARAIGEWSRRYTGFNDVAYIGRLLAAAVALGLQGPKRKRLKPSPL